MSLPDHVNTRRQPTANTPTMTDQHGGVRHSYTHAHINVLASHVCRQSYMSFIDEILPVPIVHGYGSRIAADAFGAGAGFTVREGGGEVGGEQERARRDMGWLLLVRTWRSPRPTTYTHSPALPSPLLCSR